MLDDLDNESIALLYQAEELSAEERAWVQARLQRGDTALREAIQSLRALQGVVEDAMTRADVSKPLAIPAAAASRKVARAMAQWRVDWLARPRTGEARIFRWRSLIPAAAAAAILVGTGWFAWYTFSSRPEPAIVATSPGDDSTNPTTNESETEEARNTEIAKALAFNTPEDSDLAGVEQQLSALTLLSEPTREEGVSQ